MKELITMLIYLISQMLWAADNKIPVALFSHSELSGWEDKVFNGKTLYHLKKDGKGTILLADSRQAASGLVKKQKIDLYQTPFINWRWKVIKPVFSADEKSRGGDDYAARIYVIVSGGWAFWKTKAINYVWSSSQKRGEVWENAYAGKNAMMVAVKGKMARTGRWYLEKRNIREDFKRIMGEDVRYIDAVAIMTDTDDTQSHAIAEYGDIYFTQN